MTNKEIVQGFFQEAYQNQNYDFVMEYFSKDYLDYSPAGARSNKDAVEHIGNCMGVLPTGKKIAFEAMENFKVVNGKVTESWGYWPDMEILNKLKARE